MILSHYRRASRRRTPLWVLLLGMRHPCVAQEVNEDASVGHIPRHRWTRSLRAPMVLRVCWRLGKRRDAPDRAGRLA